LSASGIRIKSFSGHNKNLPLPCFSIIFVAPHLFAAKMAKKIILETRSEPAFFTFVGISCHLMDYRFLYEFNKQLEFNFIKESDFPRTSSIAAQTAHFSFYLYRDEDQRLSYYLLSNRGDEGFIFPALKQADFILIIEGIFGKQKKEAFLSTLRSVPKVLTSYEIKSTELKNPESFLMDLELHVLQINKDLKQKKQPAP
jgi:hypothetical protein